MKPLRKKMKKPKKNQTKHAPRLAAIDAYFEDILDADHVHDQLPFQFKNGYKVETIQCSCLGCQAVLPQDAITGHVWFQDADEGGQGAPMLVIEAAGYCASCNAHSPLLIGVFDDGAFVPLPPNRFRRSRYIQEVQPEQRGTAVTRMIELANHWLLRARAALARAFS